MPERHLTFHGFDTQAAGQALGAEPHPVRDVAYGDGQALTVGETELEVYRDAGVARVTTRDARIELFRVPEYSVSGERVVFEQGSEDDRTRLQVRADSKVSFHPVLRATDEPQTNDRPPRGHRDTPAAQRPAEPTSAPSRPAASGETSEVPQEQLVGRLGRDPWFAGPDNSPMAGFPLAVNHENRTTWHKVVVFDEAATTLALQLQRGDVRKGRLVEVTGQTVVREDPTPKGVKTTKEFHATSVVQRQTSTVRRPQGR
jgi:hypothetical protein